MNFLLGLVARLVLLARRRRGFYFTGLYWAACSHLSHRWRLRCWRWFVYDGYCIHHNETCYAECESEN